MTTRIYVDDVERTRVQGSIIIDSAIGRRSTAGVTIVDPDGSLSFQRGQEIAFLKDALPPFVRTLFSGVIGPKPRERRLPGSSYVYHDLHCIDWHYLADKRLAALSWAAAMYENYTAGDDNGTPVYGATWLGQTFTPSTSHTVSKVKMLLYRVGLPGTVTLSIQGVDGVNKPDGTDLCLGTLDGNAFTTATAGEWVEFTMTTPAALTSGTMYAIVLRALDGTLFNSVEARFETAGGYGGGTGATSGDSGATWGLTGSDVMFEEWSYPTAGSIVRDLHSEYLAAEGVTIGTIQTGPDIQEMIANYQPVSMVMDVLAARANFIWEIDYFKQLNFQVRTTTEAFITVAASDVRSPTSSLTKDSTQYRNRQFIRGGTDLTDSQTETFTGDGVRESFTVGYKIHSVPTVLVNAVGQTVGIKGIDTTFDCYWAKGDSVIVFDSGSIPGAVAVVITYIGEYDIIAQAEDSVEIAARAAVEGGTGIVESISDQPYIATGDSAFAAALAMLEVYGVIGQQFMFGYSTWGLEPGQMIPLTIPAYGLAAADMLIESVGITEFAPHAMAPSDTDYSLLYTIRAIQGPVLGDWTGFFRALAGWKQEMIGRINVGADQVLLVLAIETASWDWTPVVTETVFACPICGPATIISPTLIVC